MTVTLSHKIELKANNKFKTYCRKAFGVSRFTWNWALERSELLGVAYTQIRNPDSNLSLLGRS